MRKGRSIVALVAVVGLSLAAAWPLGPAPAVRGAATFDVDSQEDAVDADPGDGLCATAEDDCTLRAAIMEANALPEANTIRIPRGTYALRLTGTGEETQGTADDSINDLDITDDLTLTGAGAGATVIDGGGIDRVLHVFAETPLTVEVGDLTIRDGSTAHSSATSNAGNGGGIFIEGGEGGGSVDHDVTLRDLTIADNEATGDDGVGGGVTHFSGRLTVVDSRIVDNHGDGAGGGVFTLQGTVTNLTRVRIDRNASDPEGAGGGLFNLGVMVIRDSTVSGNFGGGAGGGIFSTASRSNTESSVSLTIHGTTINDNTADFAAAIFSEVHPLEITRSTLSGNEAGSGSGIFKAEGDIVLTNVTISDNQATDAGSLGGGLWLITPGNTARLTNVTLTGNGASLGGNIFDQEGGTLELRNTIIANSTGGGDCNHPLTSLGNNIDTDDTCGLDQAGDLPATDPRLDTLSDNGGRTLSHALEPDSPAIDAASGACPPPAVDQRGVDRPVDGDGDGTRACDIGAFELVPEGDPPPTDPPPTGSPPTDSPPTDPPPTGSPPTDSPPTDPPPTGSPPTDPPPTGSPPTDSALPELPPTFTGEPAGQGGVGRDVALVVTFMLTASISLLAIGGWLRPLRRRGP